MDLVSAELNRHLSRQERDERICAGITAEDRRIARDELIDAATTGNGIYGTLETYLNVDGREYLTRFGEVVRHFGDLIEGTPLQPGEEYRSRDSRYLSARVNARDWLARIAASQRPRISRARSVRSGRP